MTREKVKFSFIVNDAKRKATYNRRKKGLLNKVSELSTLCGIDACAIVYSPYDMEPEVWPNISGVQRVISQFNELPPLEKTKKMIDQKILLEKLIAKVNQQLKEEMTNNREKEIIELILQRLLIADRGLQNLMPPDLKDLGSKIVQKLDEINKRMDNLRNVAAPQQAAPLSLCLQLQHQIPIALQPVAPPRLHPLFISQTSDDNGYGQEKEDHVITPSPRASND